MHRPKDFDSTHEIPALSRSIGVGDFGWGWRDFTTQLNGQHSHQNTNQNPTAEPRAWNKTRIFSSVAKALQADTHYTAGSSNKRV